MYLLCLWKDIYNVCEAKTQNSRMLGCVELEMMRINILMPPG